MEKNLQDLFGSVQDDPGDEPLLVSSASRSTGKSGEGGDTVTASLFTASTALTGSTSSSDPVLTRVIYFSTKEECDYCMGLIGDIQSRKFCAATKYEVAKHEANKFPSAPGL